MPMHCVRLTSVALLACFGAAASAQQVSSNWFRAPALSPDGKTIVFSHAGDLYTVPVTGGRAIPLTVSPAHETSPVWSRDGKHIAFASDREGNYDVFVMPSTGGPATRLTFHSADDMPSDFTPDGSAVIFSSSRMDDVKSSLFPSPILSELYSVPVAGGTPTMLLTTPAVNARFDSAGTGSSTKTARATRTTCASTTARPSRATSGSTTCAPAATRRSPTSRARTASPTSTATTRRSSTSPSAPAT